VGIASVIVHWADGLLTLRHHPDQLLGGEMECREDCLREATECDRLADLANTQATRALLAVAAFQWRKLAERAVERQKHHWPFASEAIRPN
jgi:hypothetical protein